MSVALRSTRGSHPAQSLRQRHFHPYSAVLELIQIIMVKSEDRKATRRSSVRPNDASHYNGYQSGGGASSSDSEDDDIDDTSYGTMARFVPTLVLERLRAVGEATVANKTAGTGAAPSALAGADDRKAADGTARNVPQVRVVN